MSRIFFRIWEKKPAGELDRIEREKREVRVEYLQENGTGESEVFET